MSIVGTLPTIVITQGVVGRVAGKETSTEGTRQFEFNGPRLNSLESEKRLKHVSPEEYVRDKNGCLRKVKKSPSATPPLSTTTPEGATP